MIENNYECRSKCPYDYPYYTKDANGHNTCSKINPCNGDTPYLYEGNCFKSYTQTPYSLAERNICVSICNTTEGFKFKKKIENGNVINFKKYCDNNEYVSGDYCMIIAFNLVKNILKKIKLV